LPTTRHKGY